MTTLEFVEQVPAIFDGVTAGPKRARTMSALDLSDLPSARDWHRVKAFAEKFLLTPAGKGALQPVSFMPWELRFLRGIFPAKGARPTQGALVCGRGNGKSFLASVILCYLLYADETVSPQLSVVAKDIRQANHVFMAVHRMIATSPELLERTKLHADRIVTPFNNGLVQPLPSDEGALQGFGGTFVVDELHVVNDAVWAAALFGATKLPGSQVLAFSTPPASSDSVLWRLADQAKLSPSKDFYYQEHSGDASHPITCRHCEKAANPSLGTLLTRDMLATSRKSSRESDYRRMRLATFTDKTDDVWLSSKDIEPLLTDEKISLGAKITLALDGAVTDDTTVLVGCTVEEVPKLELLAAWIPAEQDDGYRTDPEAVMNAVRKLCKSYNVVEFVADPAHYELPLSILTKEGYPTVLYPQNDSRMGGPTITMYQRIRAGTVKVVRDEVFTSHFLNCHFTETPRGGKVHKGPKREKKIDGAVASIMAMTRALYHDSQPVQKPAQVWGFA
ncbi:terminase large subunit domain-containing protein [Allobranchiibius sp. CTAmp26]|uniref:terminase large subunit domain-containing protein n=1 Tax=Allobranchiibius sp. CTAmp26 TaxID=2815214 RepID=UPI001AA0FA6F|nr:terminase large subunit [Allobranchiibius sp. CTAmp26]MBO1755706.1 hypothetical protein [Allobranchiibius sp. CTAmp26]